MVEMRKPKVSWHPTLALLGSTLLTVSISIVPRPAVAGTGQSPISVRVNIVDLPVSVTDRNGSIVDNLTKDNFRILEDGRQQAISIYEHQDLPVTVGLVVDHSGSMGSKLPEVAAAAAAFAKSSNPQDQLFVVNFNNVVLLTLPQSLAFTSDIRMLQTAIGSSDARGNTALYDAVIDSL